MMGNDDQPATRRRRGRPPKPAPQSADLARIAKRGLRRSDLDPTKPENAKSSRDIFQALGDARISEALLFAASGNEASPAYALWARMHDQEFSKLSRNTLMRESGLNIADILAMVHNKDVALGIAESGKHIAGILEDMGIESRSQIVSCEHCESARVAAGELGAKGIDVGEIPECDWCGGSGRMMRPGNQDSRKLFLEVHGLRKQGGGSTVNVGVKVDTGKPQNGGPEPITAKVQRILDGQVEQADGGDSANVQEAEIIDK